MVPSDLRDGRTALVRERALLGVSPSWSAAGIVANKKGPRITRAIRKEKRFAMLRVSKILVFWGDDMQESGSRDK
jgi:hypothetical protein